MSAPTVVGLLRQAYRAARVRLAGEMAARTTGVRWRRPARRCPDWCARDHTCTARHGYPSGEHRSPPTVWDVPYGRLVATRVQAADGAVRVELRASVGLDPTDVHVAQRQGAYLPVVVDLGIRTVLAEVGAGAEREVPGVRRRISPAA
jgi:hypothetical protein